MYSLLAILSLILPHPMALPGYSRSQSLPTGPCLGPPEPVCRRCPLQALTHARGPTAAAESAQGGAGGPAPLRPLGGRPPGPSGGG